MNVKFSLAFLILIFAGCSATPNKQNSNYFTHVSEGLKERTEYTLKQPSDSGQFEVPESVVLEDSLSRDEAVVLALWNNARFQSDLAALGFARADLLEADMLRNPVFSILFPVSPKLLETSLDIPIDVLWQRPHRIAAAEIEAQKLAENLIKNGLGLIKDVEVAYADLNFMQGRINLVSQEVQLRKQIAELDQIRLKTGQISELTAEASNIELLRAENVLKKYDKEYNVSKQKLRSLLGITSDDFEFEIIKTDILPVSSESLDKMLETALLCRPDLRAAELAIEAAGEKIGWEKSKVYNFIAVLDGDDTEDDSFTIRPGFSIEIPLFNQNDAKIARAKAELEQAAKQYDAVRQDIILEVKQAYTKYISVHEQLNQCNNNIIPSLESTFEQTQRANRTGEISLIPVLDAQNDVIEVRMQLTELIAKLNIYIAELNYSIGKKMI